MKDNEGNVINVQASFGEIFFSNFLDRVIYRTAPVSYIIQHTVSQKITISCIFPLRDFHS